MPTSQPTLPGLTPRGRPRSGVPRTERLRLSQAVRRKASSRKSLSVEVDGDLLASFKALADTTGLKMREAAEEAMRGWIKQRGSRSLKN